MCLLCKAPSHRINHISKLRAVNIVPSKPLPIIGSGKIERVRSALAAEELQMTRQQWFRIRKAALGYDVP